MSGWNRRFIGNCAFERLEICRDGIESRSFLCDWEILILMELLRPKFRVMINAFDIYRARWLCFKKSKRSNKDIPSLIVTFTKIQFDNFQVFKSVNNFRNISSVTTYPIIIYLPKLIHRVKIRKSDKLGVQLLQNSMVTKETSRIPSKPILNPSSEIHRTKRIISCLISATGNRPSSYRRNSSRGWSVSRRNPWVAREQPNNLTLFTITICSPSYTGCRHIRSITFYKLSFLFFLKLKQKLALDKTQPNTHFDCSCKITNHDPSYFRYFFL